MITECLNFECFFITFAVLLALRFTLFLVSRLFPIPPGPLRLPLVGNGYVFLFGKQQPHNVAKQLQKRYGDVVSLSFGKSFFQPDAVLLSGVDAIRQVMDFRDELGLAQVDRAKLFNNTKHLTSPGLLWVNFHQANEIRKCAAKVMSNFGVFNGSAIDDIGEKHFGSFQRVIEAHCGFAWNPKLQLSLSLGAVMHSLLFGRRPGHGETEGYMTDFASIVDKIVDSYSALPVFRSSLLDVSGENFLPFDNIEEARLYERMKTLALCEIQRRKRFDSFHLTDHITSNLDDPKKPTSSDFIDFFLQQESSEKPISLEQFSNVMAELLFFQMAFVPEQLMWALFYLARMPDEQDRLFDEIISVLPANRMPSRIDTFRLVRMEAFLQEANRYASLIPIVGLHQANRDLTVAGYRIPHQTLIWYSIYSCNFDRKYWGDPENFRVDRWLSAENGHALNNNTNLVNNMVSFGIGNRSCPGEILSRSQVFVFMVGIVRHFKLSLDPDSSRNNHSTLGDVDVGSSSSLLIRKLSSKVKFIFTERNPCC